MTRYVVDSQPKLTRILQAVETDKATGESRTTYYTYGTGLIAQEEAESGYRLYHFNHLGSTTLITDERGQVIQTFEYNPYGELLDGEIGTYRFLFSGEYGVVTDANGLYYMRARYYNVDIKRFMNQDVIVGSVENSPSLNRYAYVEGNPVNYLDPFGLEKWEGEHDWWHNYLGLLSYQVAKIDILGRFIPVLKPVGETGYVITLADMGLHLTEMQQYPDESKYYLAHLISIMIDGITMIPGYGSVFSVVYYWVNILNQLTYGKDIPMSMAEEIIYWRKMSKYYENGWISVEDIFSPEVLYTEPQYGGRH